MNILVYYIDKLDNYLPKKSIIKFILYYYVFLVFFFIIPLEVLEKIFQMAPYEENPMSQIKDTKTLFVLTTIIGPIIETLIFQFLLIKGLYLLLENRPLNKVDYNKKNLLMSIYISSFIFGSLHFYSFSYIIIMSILGFIFGILFYFSTTRKWHSFFLIFILHSIYNLTVLLLEGVLYENSIKLFK